MQRAPLKPDTFAYSSNIGQQHKGVSLGDYLCQRFAYFPRSDWELKIENKEVLLNGEKSSPQTLLAMGDEVRYIAVTQPEPKVPKILPVLFEDADLLVINKPAHIPVHPGGRYLRNTVINLAKRERPNQELFLCHRLDRETSGVLVLAKNHFAKEKMYWQFFNGDLEKTYWALVWGIPSPLAGTVDAPIGDALKGKIKIKKVVGGQGAKSARTKYRTVRTKWVEAPTWQPPEWPALMAQKKDSFKSPWPVSVVECRPLTGRTNQIRVHLGHIGAGILGDKLYDPDEQVFLKFKDIEILLDDKEPPRRPKGPAQTPLPPEMRRRLVLDAHALHAKSLGFRHPRTGRAMTVEAPLPPTWKGLY